MYAGDSYINGDSSTYYETMYSLEDPYAAGKLTEDTHKTMTAMTEFYRWLVGVKPLQAVSEHSDKLQAEALVRNFEFNHTVSDSSKPEDMTQEFWDYGAKDYIHTILARYSTPQNAITSWTNQADATKLPSDITDRENVLKKCAIYYEISESIYDSYNSLTIYPSVVKAGEGTQMKVFLSLISADTSAIFQLVPQEDGTYTGRKRYDSRTSAGFEVTSSGDHMYTIPSLQKSDEGEYFSIFYESSDTCAYVSTQIKTLTVQDEPQSGDDPQPTPGITVQPTPGITPQPTPITPQPTPGGGVHGLRELPLRHRSRRVETVAKIRFPK